MLELWFDFSCPFAYLASRRAPALAASLGTEIDWRPMLLGGVFRGIGAGAGPMATQSAQKARHNLQDMYRWAEVLGEPFAMPPTHPMRTVRALRVLLALPRREWPGAIAGIYAAYWQRGEDITSDSVLVAALQSAGTSAADIAAALRDADNHKDELHQRTAEAISLGIFGAPAWVIRRDRKPGLAPGAQQHEVLRSDDRPILLWGQDRMTWVTAVWKGWDPDRDTFAARAANPPADAAPLDVFFDVASPFSYLALTQLARLHRAPRLRPILVGALFRDIGQADVPLFDMRPAKQRYVEAEMARWARWWGVPFDMPLKFPQRTVTAQRLCLIARERGAELSLAIAFGRAMWAEQRDLEDHATLAAILASCGLPEAWLLRAQEPSIKQLLASETAAAKAAGVFGVPTFAVGDQLYWGQDRLELVARALAGWKPVHG